MLTKNFHQLQTEVSAHVAADRVRQGSYDTCIIGCLAGGENSPEFIEREYGIPLMLCRIAELIFEGLSADEANSFFAALPDAIESDGKDLSCVGWQFLAAELRSLPPVEPGMQAIIDTVIDGMDLLAQGKEWPEEDAKAAARAAADETVWPAYCAATAAYWAALPDRGASEALAAGWAAKFDVCRSQRDLLLRLVKEAPVTTTQENNS